jgi:hypothetical protein
MDEDARSAKGYQARAEQLRAEAAGIKNADTKLALLNLASNYEQLANHVLKHRKPPHLVALIGAVAFLL